LQPIADHLTDGVITKYFIAIRELDRKFEIIGGRSVFSAQPELLRNVSSYWLNIQAATQAGSLPAQYLLVSMPSAGIVITSFIEYYFCY